MKKFVTIGGNLLVFDTDTMDADAVENCHSAIDWMYIAPDDGVLKDGTQVKKGQVIVTMYGFNEGGLQKLPRKTIVIQDEIFAEYIRKYNELREAERSRYENDAPCALNCPA